jgi:hypothetical protein
VKLLDATAPAPPPGTDVQIDERARKGQRAQTRGAAGAKVVDFVRENGSSGWARTSNPPVNRLMQVVYLVGSSVV